MRNRARGLSWATAIALLAAGLVSPAVADGERAGHDGKTLFLEGNGFRLNLSGQFQHRFVFNTSDARDETNLDGFEIRRAKLSFSGHLADPALTYDIVLAHSRGNGNTFLEDAYIGYEFSNGIQFKAGLLKLPFLYEELLSSKRQLAVDRGLSTEFFTLNRSEQIQFGLSPSAALKLQAAVSDGANTNSSGATADVAEYAVTFRAQSRLAGEWGQMKDLFARGDDVALFLSGAVHVESQEGEGADELLAWTVDGIMKRGNLALMGAVMGASADADDRSQFGLLAQAGYTISDRLQPYVRFDQIDDDAAEAVNALTAGLNCYFKTHNAKLSTDVVYLASPENPGAVPGLNGGEFSSGVGLSSAQLNGEDPQVALRVQFQLLF
jgi:phosphate-selective porin OprO/OprP